MKQIQAWIERVLVPVINKITSNFWFGIVADAILYIVPFSMVSAIPSIWTIIRNFVPSLPDISAISTYSFGLIGLFGFPITLSLVKNLNDRGVIHIFK